MSIFSVNGVGKVANAENSTKLGWKKIMGGHECKKTRPDRVDDWCINWIDDTSDIVFNAHKCISYHKNDSDDSVDKDEIIDKFCEKVCRKTVRMSANQWLRFLSEEKYAFEIEQMFWGNGNKLTTEINTTLWNRITDLAAIHTWENSSSTECTYRENMDSHPPITITHIGYKTKEQACVEAMRYYMMWNGNKMYSTEGDTLTEIILKPVYVPYRYVPFNLLPNIFL
jgi:hypothetical protein